MKWIVFMLWDAFVLGGCTYLVFWKDASPWWYVLALIVMIFPDN